LTGAQHDGSSVRPSATNVHSLRLLIQLSFHSRPVYIWLVELCVLFAFLQNKLKRLGNW